jgi:hypothetical protein
MNVDDILMIVILAILIMYVYRGCKCRSGIDPTGPSNGSDDVMADEVDDVDETEEEVENMANVMSGAPLDFGTFPNNYPRGECRTGDFSKRTSCEVGNCHLGTTVSDQQFCRIQCAQDPDAAERQECYDVCMRNIC